MRPRKPSTSSGKPLPRPRYLGIEVAGVPLPSPRGLEQLLRRLSPDRAEPPTLRVVRVEFDRAIVEVSHLELATARAAWNRVLDPPVAGWRSIRTHRTWGTLVKAKAWLRSDRPRVR